MIKKILCFAILFFLVGCTKNEPLNNEPFYKEDKVTIKECTVITDQEVNKLNTIIEYEVKGDYALRYHSDIFLDDQLDFALESQTNLFVELIKHGEVIESTSTLDEGHLSVYSKLNEENVLNLIANVSYADRENELFAFAGSVRLKFTKVEDHYIAELVPIKTF